MVFPVNWIGFSFSELHMLVNRKDEAICSETVILSMRLDGFINLAVFLQPPGLDSLVSRHRLSKISQLLLLATDQSSTKRCRSRADKLGYFSLGLEENGCSEA